MKTKSLEFSFVSLDIFESCNLVSGEILIGDRFSFGHDLLSWGGTVVRVLSCGWFEICQGKVAPWSFTSIEIQINL